jgi:hypothetical protein
MIDNVPNGLGDGTEKWSILRATSLFVTGAGGGLSREHALLVARHGVKVLVNDLGGSVLGEGQGSTRSAF